MHQAPARPARIILDANILVSAVIASGRARGSEIGLTVDRALGGDAVVITCPRLLTEVERALRTPRLAGVDHDSWAHTGDPARWLASQLEPPRSPCSRKGIAHSF